MVSLIEASTQLAQTKQQLSSQEKTLIEQQKKLQSQRFPSRTLRFQQEVIARSPRTYAGKTERFKDIFQQQKQTALSQVVGKLGDIKSYRTETLVPYEKQIEVAREQKVLRERQQKAYNLLNTLIIKGRGGTPKSADIKRIKEAFSSANLNSNEGVKIYSSELKHSLWLAEEYSPRTSTPKYTDSLGQGMSIVPELAAKTSPFISSKETFGGGTFSTTGMSIQNIPAAKLNGVSLPSKEKFVYSGGKIVGVDTGTMSRLATPTEKLTGQISGTFPLKDIKKSEPFIEQRVVSTFIPKGETKGIPTTDLFYIDPSKKIERKVTKEERIWFEKQPQDRISTEKPPSSIKRFYGETKGKVSSLLSQRSPISKEFETKLISKTEKGVSSVFGKSAGEFAGGVTDVFIPSSKGELLTDAGLIFVGGAFGKAGQVGSKIGKSKISTKLIGKEGKTILKGGLKYGRYGLGGLYAFDVGRRFYQAETPKEYGKAFGGVTKEIGLFSLGSRLSTGQPLFNKKITIKEPLRKVKEPQSKELVMDIVKDDKLISYGKYKISGEIRPPIKVTQTTKVRKFFGMKPKKEYILPERKFLQSTLGYQEIGKPLYVYEYRQGSKFLRPTYMEGQGEQLFTGRLDLTGMDKIRKFGFKRLVEAKTSLPTSEKFVPSLLEKDSIKQISNIFTKQSLKIKPSSKGLTIKSTTGLGKQTKRFLAFTESRPFKETKILEVYKGETVFKDITKPFARASGKTPVLRQTLIKYKEPFVFEGKSNVEFIPPSSGKKIPFSKTFQLPIQEQVKVLPKPLLPKITTPKVTTIIKGGSGSISPITIPSASKYAGTGLYERTEGGLFPGELTGKVVLPKQNNFLANQPSFSFNARETLITKTSLQPLSKTVLKSNLKPLSKAILKTPQKEITKTILKTLQKQQQKTMQKQMQKQMFKFPTPTITTGTFGYSPTATSTIIPSHWRRKKQPQQKTPIRKSKIFQPTKYTPSFTARVFKITAKEKPKKILGGYGFGIRPIIGKPILKL